MPGNEDNTKKMNSETDRFDPEDVIIPISSHTVNSIPLDS